MNADRLGIFSALLASVCCLGPVLLALLGLGSLGVGALLGRYHWWFIAVAIVLLVRAWRSYRKETARCLAVSCQMAHGKTTRTALTLASAVVAIFMGLNLYTYASQQRFATGTNAPTHTAQAEVIVPVEGMTCFTCELTVESSLKKLPGLQSADARVGEQAAYVQYDPSRVTVEELMAAINKTGYRARQPK